MSPKIILASQAHIVSMYRNIKRKLLASLYIFLFIWHLPDDSWSGQPKPVVVCNESKLTKLRGLSPRANYTDRAAAAGRRN